MNSMVYPSGAASRAVSMPILPPAPARLSTTTDWPKLALNFCAMMRPMVSIPPPGANGTINRIGRVGYCSRDVDACAIIPAAAADSRTFASRKSAGPCSLLASSPPCANGTINRIGRVGYCSRDRSEEHTSELQSHSDLVCRLLLEKKKNENDLDSALLNMCYDSL